MRVIPFKDRSTGVSWENKMRFDYLEDNRGSTVPQIEGEYVSQ